jgi:hypothetical protein
VWITQQCHVIEQTVHARLTGIDQFALGILHGRDLHELTAVFPVDRQRDDLGIQTQQAHDEFKAHRMHALGAQLDQFLLWQRRALL